MLRAICYTRQVMDFFTININFVDLYLGSRVDSRIIQYNYSQSQHLARVHPHNHPHTQCRYNKGSNHRCLPLCIALVLHYTWSDMLCGEKKDSLHNLNNEVHRPRMLLVPNCLYKHHAQVCINYTRIYEYHCILAFSKPPIYAMNVSVDYYRQGKIPFNRSLPSDATHSYIIVYPLYI